MGSKSVEMIFVIFGEDTCLHPLRFRKIDPTYVTGKDDVGEIDLARDSEIAPIPCRKQETNPDTGDHKMDRRTDGT